MTDRTANRVWRRALHGVAACFFAAVWCPAADWPTWRADVSRSGVSTETLPAQLELVWEWELPAPQPAFPFETRLQFDTCYEPVAADGRVVFGSPADGTIRCLDAVTGKELWRVFTGGPVRLAPVLWEGRVIAGSDDGWLYCLNGADGALLWKRRLVSEDRPDLRHLGSNRLISPWPVRGGPVVADGVVYAGSGVWPTMGVALWAIDAKSGNVIWCNDRVNWIKDVRIDHNIRRDMGLTPCGYMAVSGDRLIVANGRSHPAGVQRATGELIYYVQGYRNGHCRVALSGIYGFVGKTGLISLRDFREVASRWAEAGDAAPNAFDGAKMDLFEGPLISYKNVAACDAFSVFDGQIAYGLINGVFFAYDLRRAALSKERVEKPTGVIHPYRWDAPVLWRKATDQRGEPGRTLIKAGNRLYGCAGTTLLALDLAGPAGGPGKVSWEADLGQAAESLAAANGRLFVSTRQGKLFCFGAATGDEAGRWSEPGSMPQAVGSWRAESARLARVAGVNAGFAVIRSGSVEAVYGLLAESSLSSILIAANADEADRVRRELSGAGVLGPRVTVVPASATLPPYIASLTVVAAPDLTEDLGSLWRAVHPYGGTLAILSEAPEATAERLVAAGLPGAVVRTGERAVLVRREGPLPGSAPWTHESADAARTYFSRDKLVKAPLGVLWYGEGPGYGFFKIHDYGLGHKPQVANGRVIALQQSTGILFGYDAYTGRVLWQDKTTARTNAPLWIRNRTYEWSWTATGGPSPRYACQGDSVYVGYEGICRLVDAATGEETGRWDFTDLGREGVNPSVKGVFVTADIVAILAGYTDERAIEKGLWDGDFLVVFRREDGRRLWVRQASERFNVKAVALLNGVLYCVDAVSPVSTDRWIRRGASLKESESTVYALNGQTGAVRWQQVFRQPFYGRAGWTTIMGRDDWLSCAPEQRLVLCGRGGRARALRAATGEVVWERECGSQPFIVAHETITSQSGAAFRLEDGTPLEQPALFARGGCNYGVAGEHLAFVRNYTAMWVEVESRKRHLVRNLRAGCSASLVPADGLLNAPNFSPGCMCNYPLQVCSAWVHMPGIETWAGTEPLTMTPPLGDNGVRKISAEEAEKLREQTSANLLATVAKADAALLGLWTFDAGTEIKDATRDGSQLKLATRVEGSVSLAPGVAGQCLVLTGKGRLVSPLPAEARPRDAVSLSAWIRPDPAQPAGYAGIVECAQVYRLCLVNTDAPYMVHFGVQFSDGKWASAGCAKKVPAGEWTHVAGTFDGETGICRLFVNGEEASTGRSMPGGLLRPQQGSLHIGLRDTSAHFTGALDEVRFYRGALSRAVARQLARRR